MAIDKLLSNMVRNWIRTKWFYVSFLIRAPRTVKTKSCQDANCIVMSGSVCCHDDDHQCHHATSEDKVGIMTTLSFQRKGWMVSDGFPSERARHAEESVRCHHNIYKYAWSSPHISPFNSTPPSAAYSGTPHPPPPGKARKVSLKLNNLVHFHAPFLTNHVYFTPHERPPPLKGHNLGWPL